MDYQIKLFKEINEELKEAWVRVEKNSLTNSYKVQSSLKDIAI